MLKVVLANQARGAYHTFQHGMPAAVKAVDAAACMQMVARRGLQMMPANQAAGCRTGISMQMLPRPTRGKYLPCAAPTQPACSISQPSLKIDKSLLSALGSIKSLDWPNKCLFPAVSSLPVPGFGTSQPSLNLDCI